MTTTSSATSGTSGTAGAASSSRIKLNANFDTFLKMLTTQLQFQDPTKPMDTSEFTNQLVMYSQVEQQLSSNDKLDKLIALQQGQGTNAALGYLGWNVTSESSNMPLVNSKGSFTIATDTAPSKISISITDAKTGKIVRGLTVDGNGQTNYDFSWDGKDNNGNQLADGTYKISVSTTDSAGKKITSHVYTGGVVTGISTDSNGNTVLEIGDTKVSPDAVRTVRAPATTQES